MPRPADYKRMTQRPRLEIALALFYEHKKMHDQEWKSGIWWAIGFFAVAVVSALQHDVFATLVFLGLFVVNGVIRVSDRRRAEMCILAFKEEIIELAYDDFDEAVAIDWEDGTYKPNSSLSV